MPDEQESTETVDTDEHQGSGGEGTPPPAGEQSSGRLPDDHPLVKAYQATKERLSEATARVREYEDRDKTESQRLTEAAEEAQRKAETAERELVRMRVAMAKGLPPELAARLQGDDEESLNRDADELLKLVKPPTTRVPHGQRQAAEGPPDMSALIRQAAGRGA